MVDETTALRKNRGAPAWRRETGDLPVEQTTKFDLYVNLNAVRTLGVTIPETFLTRADKVIE